MFNILVTGANRQLGSEIRELSTSYHDSFTFADYVFDGKNYKPYEENDQTNPSNLYGKTKEKLTVINDQVGTPTYARDLAQAILDLIPQINNDKPEIYHYSNEGVLSWYDFAKEIMKMAKLDCKIEPIATKDYSTLVTRPHFNLLNKAKIKETFNIEVPFWKDSLGACLKEMRERR